MNRDRPEPGIVTNSATVVSATPAVVRVGLDVQEHRFLRDHLVDGRPLLSTVMGIEVMACAVALVRPGTASAEVVDVRVGPPFILPPAGVGHVDVIVSGASTAHCEVRSDAATAHFAADVPLVTAVAPAAVTAAPAQQRADDRGVTAEAIYGLYFHGESFRVIASAGLAGDTVRARLAPALVPIVDPPRRSLTAPLLVELCMQAAGLWQIAVQERMTVPRSIERIQRFSTADADTGTPLIAVVTARAGGGVFDAVVVDERGTVHLAVTGYRSVDFVHPYDRTAAATIRAALVPPHQRQT